MVKCLAQGHNATNCTHNCGCAPRQVKLGNYYHKKVKLFKPGPWGLSGRSLWRLEWLLLKCPLKFTYGNHVFQLGQILIRDKLFSGDNGIDFSFQSVIGQYTSQLLNDMWIRLAQWFLSLSSALGTLVQIPPQTGALHVYWVFSPILIARVLSHI